jgi:hypothetical protein
MHPVERAQLAAILARMDGVIVEARSHFRKPSPDTESREVAYQILIEMQRLRADLEQAIEDGLT